jgi:hypothetical protein
LARLLATTQRTISKARSAPVRSSCSRASLWRKRHAQVGLLQAQRAITALGIALIVVGLALVCAGTILAQTEESLAVEGEKTEDRWVGGFSAAAERDQRRRAN